MTIDRAGERDVLGEVRAELAGVVPSAGFAAAVRARVDRRQPARRGWFWIPLAAPAAIIAVVIAIWLRAGPAAPSRIQVQAPASETAPRLASPVPVPLPAPAASPAPVRARQPERVVVSRPAPRQTTAATESAFEVITNQPAVLERMWREAARTNRLARVVELPAAAAVDPDALIVVPEVVVNPIVVTPIGGGAGGQGRVQRVRSPQATGSLR